MNIINPPEYLLPSNPLCLLTSALPWTQSMKGAISPLVTTNSWKTVASTWQPKPFSSFMDGRWAQEGVLQLFIRFDSFCFGQLKRIAVLPDSKPCPPFPCGLLVFQTAVKNVMGASQRGQSGLSRVAFSAGVQWAFRKCFSQGQQPNSLSSEGALIILNYIGQPLPGGGPSCSKSRSWTEAT